MPIKGAYVGKTYGKPRGGYTSVRGGTTGEIGGGGFSGFPIYEPYKGTVPTPRFPGMRKGIPFPGADEMPEMPVYEPGGGAYPITQLPTYAPTEEAYPTYQRPETGGVSEELMTSIKERMTGEGTAGAESAIYERGETRVDREYEEGLKRIDEQMSARGLTSSGIHGEAIQKLEEERQRSMADLSRQITIYGQQAIESAMAKGQQYVEYQSAEAARELSAGERGWAGRVGERIRSFESKARAAESRGASEQAAYNSAIAERVRAYESQARAVGAKTDVAFRKWEAKTNEYMQRYQFQLQKAQMLQQAKMEAYRIGQEEYRKVFESKYAASKDRWLAEQAANAAAERKKQAEWERRMKAIEMRKDRYTWRTTPKTFWGGGIQYKHYY